MDGAAGVDGLLNYADNAVIVECIFGGTQKGEWPGLAPTGRSMEVAAALFFLFEDDGLVCERVYFDHATVLRQLESACSGWNQP